MKILGFNIISVTFGVHKFINKDNLIIIWDSNQKDFSVYLKVITGKLV